MTIEQREETAARVQIFKALADPTRLEIIKTLHYTEKEMSCTEVGEKCDASKSNASYHFKTLREAGLINVRKESQTKYTSINYETFEKYLPGFLNTL